MPHTLERTTFETSRLLEFFSEKELAMQIGCPRAQWPIALLKELIDNALDACEIAGLLPDIAITLEPDALSIRDHGPGLPVATLERSLDYHVRVSDKATYVSPSRGQLGNAFKCLWAAPFVVHGEAGSVEVTTGCSTHRIAVMLDRIAQQPNLCHRTRLDGLVKTGTLVRLIWPGIASCLALDADPSFYKSAAELVEEYAAFNPHLSVTYREPEYETTFTRSAPAWQKWMPHRPTSAHWYTVERLRALIAAYLTAEKHADRARTIREFVAEFDGLSGSIKPKRVLEAAGLSRAYLHDLIAHGDVALEPVTRLLAAMRRETRPVQPAALGVLGEAHVRTFLTTYGEVEPESLKYYKVQSVLHGMPFVLELACGWYTREGSDLGRRTIVGVNWTPALKPPFPELQALLGEARVDSFDPVVVVVHLATPCVEFTDRGKGAVALPVAVREALARGMATVTKPWKALKRQSDREERVRERMIEHYLKHRRRQSMTVKQAAYQVMGEAYLKASDQGRLPANARQIMYAARPWVLELTDGKSWKKSSYFTQKLLPNFIDAHPELTAAWDVVFDNRGHLVEPHTKHRIGLGTVEVRTYIAHWHEGLAIDDASVELAHGYPTRGPANRYGYALFIEKEGFYPLLEAAQIAERYDLAIMSTKGMSVTAARQLVERLSEQGVTILVCHDFDKSGFSILHTLQSNTRRYTFRTRPKVIDLGLRLSDVEAMTLQSELVEYRNRKDPRVNLRQRGATEAECQYLVRQGGLGGWTGQRVELNAMTSDQFIAWLEAKLIAVGVQKVLPDQETLAKAYRRAIRQRYVQRAIDEVLKALAGGAEIDVPDDLVARLRHKLDGSAESWDAVLWELVDDDEIEDEDSEDSEDSKSLE